MVELCIQGWTKCKCVTTTNIKHRNLIYPNLIKDKVVSCINQVWCSDITYIHILSDFVYLASILISTLVG